MRPSSRRLVARARVRDRRARPHAERARRRSRAQAAPVPSLEPQATQAAVAAARSAQDLPAVRRRGRLPAAPCRVLRGDRLAPPRDEARRCGVSVRPVLRLGPTRRRRQDEAATGSGVADPRARPERPRVGRDPFHRLAEVGHEHRLRLVPGRRRGEAPDGVRRVRRGRGGHVGAERALVGRAAGRRNATHERPRASCAGSTTPRARGRRPAASCSIVGVGQRVPEIATYKARMQEWLQDSAFWVDMNAYVERLVAGGVRRRARLRGARARRSTNRRDALVDYLRHSDLLAARRRRRLRHGERVLRERGKRARQRGVAVGLRVRVDARRPST